MTSDSSGISDSQATQGQFSLSLSLSLSPPFLTSVHLSWIYQQTVEWEEYLCDGKFATGFFSQAISWFPKKGCKRRREAEEEGFMILNMMRKTYELMGFMGGKDGFVVVQTESSLQNTNSKGSYELIAWFLCEKVDLDQRTWICIW